jgi:ATP-dependent Clp protease protease subunit
MIQSYKFFNLKQTGENDAELRIEGDIIPSETAWLYEWFGDPHAAPNKFRDELKKYDGKNITVWINSNGGNIIAGCAIYNAIKEHNGKKTVKIDGIAASIASVIAMSGDEILMSPASLLMLHNPWVEAAGDVYELEKKIKALNSCKEIIINAYEKKTKLSRDKLSAMMDEESWLEPKQAIDYGFADGMLYEDEELRDFKNIINSAKFCREYEYFKAKINLEKLRFK